MSIRFDKHAYDMDMSYSQIVLFLVCNVNGQTHKTKITSFLLTFLKPRLPSPSQIPVPSIFSLSQTAS